MSQTILLIEQDPALRRLITLGLQSRSIRVIATPSLTYDNLSILNNSEQPPDLLLLDIDGSVNSNSSTLTGIQSHPYLSTLPTIVLAWENSLLEPGQTQYPASTPITCMTKPFDARTLYGIIEQLLHENATAPQKANTALTAQERLLLAHTARPAPSIWPIITAAAILLTFIGLMVNISIILLGLLIFFIAVMGWSLSKTPETIQLPSTRLGI
jgi:DNA-binding response OmpR family regulator